MKGRLVAFTAVLAKFAAGQSALQFVQAGNGLVLVWLLGVSDFAIYAVFTGAMGLSSVMMGLGITSTVVALVGDKTRDKCAVGCYLFAALRLRLLLLIPVSVVGVTLIVYAGMRNGYPGTLLLLLSASLLVCNFCTAQSDLFAAPLQMLGRVGTIYKWTASGEVIKMIMIVGLWSIGALDAVFASIATASSLCLNYWGLRSASLSGFVKPAILPLNEQRQVWRLTAPSIPNALFGAFLGQITIVIAALVGNTAQIASVGALGRLARVLAFLQAANPMILGPALAKLSSAQLWRALPRVMAVAFVIALAVAVSGALFPDVLLFLLGKNYRDLEQVVWLVTLSAGLGYFTSVLTTIAAFRHWVAWWNTIGIFCIVLCAQIAVALLFDLRTVSGVLVLGIAANGACALMLSGLVFAARFRPGWLRSKEGL
jgi:O-antigen/teichoic acid export membrane protein